MQEVWVEHINICRIIQYVALIHGFDITLRESEEIWQNYSDSMSAGWILESYDDLYHMWILIKNQFIKKTETQPEFEERIKEMSQDVKEMIEQDDECEVTLNIKGNWH